MKPKAEICEQFCPSWRTDGVTLEELKSSADTLSNIAESAATQRSLTPRAIERLRALALQERQELDGQGCDKGPWKFNRGLGDQIECGRIDGVTFVSPKEVIEIKRGE